MGETIIKTTFFKKKKKEKKESNFLWEDPGNWYPYNPNRSKPIKFILYKNL